MDLKENIDYKELYLQLIKEKKNFENNWKTEKAIYEQKIELLNLHVSESLIREKNFDKMNKNILQALDTNNPKNEDKKNKDQEENLSIENVKIAEKKAKILEAIIASYEKKHLELQIQMENLNSEYLQGITSQKDQFQNEKNIYQQEKQNLKTENQKILDILQQKNKQLEEMIHKNQLQKYDLQLENSADLFQLYQKEIQLNSQQKLQNQENQDQIIQLKNKIQQLIDENYQISIKYQNQIEEISNERDYNYKNVLSLQSQLKILNQKSQLNNKPSNQQLQFIKQLELNSQNQIKEIQNLKNQIDIQESKIIKLEKNEKNLLAERERILNEQKLEISRINQAINKHEQTLSLQIQNNRSIDISNISQFKDDDHQDLLNTDLKCEFCYGRFHANEFKNHIKVCLVPLNSKKQKQILFN